MSVTPETQLPETQELSVAGDFVRRDKIVDGDEVHGDKVHIERLHIERVDIDNRHIEVKPEARPLFAGAPAMPVEVVGRDALLDDLVQRMLYGKRRLLALEGLPGVGKTTLALALAHDQRVLDHFSDGVLWASLSLTPDIRSILDAWTVKLEISPDSWPSLQVRDQAQTIRDTIGQRRFLVVLDDVWHKEAVELLRGGPHVTWLMTTRKRSVAHTFAGAGGTVSVPELDQEAGFRLLCELAPKACRTNPGVVRRLVRTVGGLPLALMLVGSYLAEPERHPSDPLAEVNEHLLDPARRLALATERLGAPDDVQPALQRVMELSLSGLLPNQVEAFYALGAFAPMPASADHQAAQTVAQVGVVEIDVLGDRNLLEASEDDSLAMHPVLADAAHTKTPSEVIRRHREYYLEQLNSVHLHGRQVESIFAQLTWSAQAEPAPLLAGLQRFVQNLEQPEPDRRSIALLMTTLPAFARFATSPDEMLVLLELVARHLDTPAQRRRMVQAMTSPLAAALPARQQAQLRVHRAALLAQLDKLPEARADYQAARRILEAMRASNALETDDYRLEARLHLGDGNLAGLQAEQSADPEEQQALQAEALQLLQRAAQSVVRYGKGRDALLEVGVYAELSAAFAQRANWTAAEKHYLLALGSLEPVREVHKDQYAWLRQTAGYMHWQKAQYLRTLAATAAGDLAESGRVEEIRRELRRAIRHSLRGIETLAALAGQSEGLVDAHENAGDYTHELAELSQGDERNALLRNACVHWDAAWEMASELGLAAIQKGLAGKRKRFCPQARA